MALPSLSLILPSSRTLVPSSFFILLFFIKLIPSPRARNHKLKLALLALLFLNWRSLPFYWHLKQFTYIFSAWWRFRVRRKVSEFAGKKPFDVTLKRNEVCSWDLGDYNMQ
jgi:CBS domain containing-hemolysin-like protein